MIRYHMIFMIWLLWLDIIDIYKIFSCSGKDLGGYDKRGCDADPSQQDLLWLPYTHTHELQKSCGEKGAVWLLSKLKRGPLTSAWKGFYCFSGHITLRAILIYYAQGHHRWLPFKEDKGQDTANYFKEKDVTSQGGSCSHSILGWFSTDFRKMKILSKHLLPQFRVREF